MTGRISISGIMHHLVMGRESGLVVQPRGPEPRRVVKLFLCYRKPLIPVDIPRERAGGCPNLPVWLPGRVCHRPGASVCLLPQPGDRMRTREAKSSGRASRPGMQPGLSQDERMVGRLGQVNDGGKGESHHRLNPCQNAPFRPSGERGARERGLTMHLWSCMVLPWHGTRSRPPCTSLRNRTNS